MTMKLISCAIKSPYMIWLRPIWNMAVLHDPGVPRIGAMIGMNISLTKALMRPVEAVPITKATANETILYSLRNVANSVMIFFMLIYYISLRCLSNQLLSDLILQSSANRFLGVFPRQRDRHSYSHQVYYADGDRAFDPMNEPD